MDPDFYEFQYSPSRSVPNAQSYFQAWREGSAQARATLAGCLNLAYGAGEKETLDLFPAQNSRGLLVFIHGGYWRAFDKDDFSWMAAPLVQAGYSLAMLNYALCPSVSIAQITEQCRRAVAWLYHHGKQYGVDAGQMIVSGHSAGGHLSAMLFATDWQALGVPDTAIAGGIAISGLFDLEPLIAVSFNSDLKLDVESARAISPIYHQPRVKSRLVVAVGAKESAEFKRQSQLLVEAWPAVCSPLLTLPGRHHFDVLDELVKGEGLLWQWI
jgi:arylformamidase